MPVRFMSEVSSNHACDLGRCLDFIDMSAEIGCNAVKFDLFRAEKVFAPEVLNRNETRRVRRGWELHEGFIGPIAERCERRGVIFCGTPFDPGAVELLNAHVGAFKIASSEILSIALLEAVARTGKPVILQTSFATMDEVQAAMMTLRKTGADEITLLHSVAAYPLAASDANLGAIKSMRDAAGCPVGWSDHTVSPGVVHRAVHKWNASLIEFHLDFDGRSADYASGHCWLPYEIGAVIRDMRAAELADGSGVKAPMPSEIQDRDWRADPVDGLRPLRSIRHSWAA